MKKVNVHELARMYAERSPYDISYKDAEADIKLLSKLMTEIVANGDEVRLPEFGIVPAERAGHKVKNPRSGEMMDVPTHRTALLKRYKPMKDALNPPKKKETKKASKKTSAKKSTTKNTTAKKTAAKKTK